MTSLTPTIDEKSVALDDAPYFPISFPGKVCCFCNLGGRSSLGQGDVIKLEVPSSDDDYIIDEKESLEFTKKDELEVILSNRKIKIPSKFRTSTSCENAYELDKVGHAEVLHIQMLQEGFNVYAHRMCLMWSIRRGNIDDINPNQLKALLTNSLSQKCSFCGQYGASVTCKMNCTQVYHWPCAAASGCFLILESLTLFCAEHLSQVPILCSEANVECQYCSSVGDLSKLVMCFTCGDHYHSTCIGLANLPDTKSGWSCPRCSKCQICRQHDSSDGRYVKCEQCQKIYHALCLRPIISSIPKYGWKCNRCRICTDCGSRTPGAGTSSRWHCHYTICDSCYQQRNKGFSCPICQRAYRAAAHKEMVQCSSCHKFVHSTCDDEADLNAYHKKKENNPDYDYVCPHCKMNLCTDTELIDETIFLASHSSEQLCKEIDIDAFNKGSIENVCDDQFKISNKKRVCVSSIRGKGGKLFLQRPSMITQLSKKRTNRAKARQIMIPNSAGDRYISRSTDSDISTDKKMLLCSSRDKFTMIQDVCMMCGSIGLEDDAHFITCSQCGQCYHPYCVNVTPSKVMLQKGWRCLDCTVCEGCGKKNDEARLLLCDECDVSYHIYCMDPPLDAVPQGNWKCKFCAICQKCGVNSVVRTALCENNILQCQQCLSENICPICNRSYKESEMIIQCNTCKQWLHFHCDPTNIDVSIEYYETNYYKCNHCSCVQSQELLINSKIILMEENSQQSVNSNIMESKINIAAPRNTNSINEEDSETFHWLDNVCLSEQGLNMIKSLTTEIKRKRKLRQNGSGAQIKDTSAAPSIESSVTGIPTCPTSEEGLFERQTTEIYKDGMVWDGIDNTPPEGFTIFTNEDGVNILRKKRQRNLQKLGIGGFSVRNRVPKRDNEENNGNSQLNSLAFSMEKKKKMPRKKQKNKLSEAYPVYLQEAFFGKSLLESDEVFTYESESSNDLDSCNLRIHFNDIGQNNLTENETNGIDVKACEKNNESNKQIFESLPLETQMLLDQVDMCLTSNNGINMDQQPTKNNFDNQFASENVLTFNQENSLFAKSETKTSMYSIDQKCGTSTSNDCRIESERTKELYISSNFVKSGAQQQMISQIIDSAKAPSNSFIVSNDEVLNTETKTNEPVLEGIIAGTQKTAEKMRRDEELGLMATISAVLYSNTKHPDLKDIYPNWNDRCKQILKIWRSLSTDKKSPFLQHAKDNRSALRLRRAQQEQQKISLQQKAFKEEELERVWKQHQTKVKEEQIGLFSNSTFPYNNLNVKAKTSGSNMTSFSPVTSTANNTALNPKTLQNERLPIMQVNEKDNPDSLELSTYDPTDEVGNKKLRNLLQQNLAPVLLTESNDPFIHNDGYKMPLISNNSTISSNNQFSNRTGSVEYRQNYQKLEHDFRSRTDLKLMEPTEPISTTSSDLEKLDADENTGFCDILGGLGEGDDDDLLQSLTSEIGDDFNILEYADPELDVLTSSQNVLNTLDFEENEKNSHL